MLHALRERANTIGDRPALWTRRGGRYRATSWRDYFARVRKLACGLERLGFGQGDVLAILSFNREEWLIADLAAMALGGVAVGLYTTASPEQLAWVVGHSGARFLVVENPEYLGTMRALRGQLPKLQHLLLVEGDPIPDEGVRRFDEVLRMGEDADPAWLDRRIDALDPSSLATLIYTSGTTGNPKGVMLSHHNICWTAARLSQAAQVGADDVVVSYLPLSHVAEQTCSIFGPILNGIQVYFAESIDQIGQALKEVRPTAFFGVPRVWEKFKAKAEEGIRAQSPQRQRLVAWARQVASDYHGRILRGERPPLTLEAEYALAQRLVFSRLKAKIGLDRARIFASSAAPIGRDVIEFFLSLDIVIREVYGQSEVTGPTSVSTPEHTRLGTVGRPMIGVEVRIADDGEILVRGGNVCMGYFRDEVATRELLEGGWLHSGDLGELDAEGYLRITGRKKEIVITSAGKKTAPANIEGYLKAIDPVGNAMVVGERRNYLVALLPLDPEKVPAFAKARGWPDEPEVLAHDERFLRYLEERIEQDVNRHLARFEHIRRFAVLPHDFTTEGGELTPTLKVRRSFVEQKYADRIEALYAQKAVTA
ncbi:MAG: long-chain fatty acid--CoA ligase [Myxococcaceae bacterium]|nr:long-chain fatty acid--CoA ligase [Myxococcaceae bacterium]